MSDLMPSYMQARQVLRQLQRYTQPLLPPVAAPGRPSIALPAQPTFDQADRALVGAWKTYLKWEESNPLELEEKDRPTLVSRVQSVYRKALVRMRFFGEIWWVPP
jgi:cleavage stimulation factor subunit 3